MGFKRFAILCAIIPAVAACQTAAIDRTQFTDEAILEEGLTQEIAVKQAEINRRKRIYDIGFPMLVAATELCGPDWTVLDEGIALHSLDDFAVADHDVMTEGFGLSYRPRVSFVVKDSPADIAGIQPGDTLKKFNDIVVTGQTGAIAAFYEAVTSLGEVSASALSTYVMERDDKELVFTLRPVMKCNFPIFVQNDTIINAFADGENIVFTRGIMNLMNDKELATIFGHEAAHNIMSQIEKSAANRVPAQAAGFALDMLAALAGVNTQGFFMNQAGQRADLAFSADFEAEADVVGLYVLAMAGHSVDGVEAVWRKLTAESGGDIYAGSTHPPTAERYLTLARHATEIERKRASGERLWPPLPKDWEPRSKSEGSDTQQLPSEDEMDR